MGNVVGFRKNREGWLVSDTHRECTMRGCGNIFEITSKTVTICPSCNTARVKAARVEEKMWQRAKNRSRLSGLEFDITVGDIDIPDECPVMGLPLMPHVGSPGGRPNSPSLDRIDSRKGYTKDNIQVISHLANQMKSSATPQQMLKFADWAIKTYRDKPGTA
jgi:hypothetical protein